MPRITYKALPMRDATLATVAQANTIIAQYAAQGFDLTLRQLYYQMVARALIPNNLQSYKRLGDIINDARLAGLIDWNRIVDRTRNVRANSHWSSPADIMRSAANSYAIDKWADQDWRVEVWIEKDALVGVIEGVCQDLDVAYFSCRGYTSQSEMWSASQRLLRYTNAGKSVKILHLGDHDPSGIDMTRDIRERLDLFMYSSPDVEVDRIALTWAQVQQYNPPPNPAKATDSRYESYLSAYGAECWELDALEPQVIADLIRDGVQGVRDDARWYDALARQGVESALLEEAADRWLDVASFLNNGQP